MTTPPVQTHVRKILVGTPVRKVTGAQAQTVGDLTNVDTTAGSGLVAKAILQYNAATGKFEPTLAPTGLTLSAGNF